MGNLYHVSFEKPKDCVCTVTESLPENDQFSKEDLWHRRYGHLGVENLQKLAKDNLVDGFDYYTSKISFCEPCLKGKHQRSKFPPNSERIITESLELIHSDVYGKL